MLINKNILFNAHRRYYSLQLSENAGFGFDKMETNWYQYNKTKPEYTIDFDFVIVDFVLKPGRMAN